MSELFEEVLGSKPEGLEDALINYVAGGYDGPVDALDHDPDLIEYVYDNMERTDKPLYRIEDGKFTASTLKRGVEFSFENDLRSFSKGRDVVDRMLEEGEEMNMFPTEPVVFETVGSTYHFDMSAYTKTYEEYFQTQKESLVGGRFRVLSIENTEPRTILIRQITKRGD